MVRATRELTRGKPLKKIHIFFIFLLFYFFIKNYNLIFFVVNIVISVFIFYFNSWLIFVLILYINSSLINIIFFNLFLDFFVKVLFVFNFIIQSKFLLYYFYQFRLFCY